MFKDAEPDFLQNLVLLLKRQFYHPGQDIVALGEMGKWRRCCAIVQLHVPLLRPNVWTILALLSDRPRNVSDLGRTCCGVRAQG